jgi:hypothetical protein
MEEIICNCTRDGANEASLVRRTKVVSGTTHDFEWNGLTLMLMIFESQSNIVLRTQIVGPNLDSACVAEEIGKVIQSKLHPTHLDFT